jgi:hypothetical protein
VQIYIPSSIHQLPAAIIKLESCINDLHHWLQSQRLVLNPKKTEFIIFASKRNNHFSNDQAITVDGHTIPVSDVVRDLGIMLDTTLTFSSHINKVRQSTFMHLRIISKMRKCLSKRHCAMVIDALVLSRLNFCASLFVGLPKCQVQRLQSIINYSIKIVEKLHRRENVSPHLKYHEWLPAEFRMRFRLLQIVHASLHHGVPLKLSSSLTQNTSQYSLRSIADTPLTVPRTRSRMGERAFAVMGPRLFNDLPSSVRNSSSFSVALRKHLVTIMK